MTTVCRNSYTHTAKKCAKDSKFGGTSRAQQWRSKGRVGPRVVQARPSVASSGLKTRSASIRCQRPLDQEKTAATVRRRNPSRGVPHKMSCPQLHRAARAVPVQRARAAPQTCPGGAWRSRTAGCPRAPATPQATGSSRPVSDACLIVSTKWCRSTAVSNVGRRLCPVRIASANRAYICPTLNGSPRGKSAGT